MADAAEAPVEVRNGGGMGRDELHLACLGIPAYLVSFPPFLTHFISMLNGVLICWRFLLDFL